MDISTGHMVNKIRDAVDADDNDNNDNEDDDDGDWQTSIAWSMMTTIIINSIKITLISIMIIMIIKVLSYMEDHLKNKQRLEQEWVGLCAYEAEPNSTAIAFKVVWWWWRWWWRCLWWTWCWSRTWWKFNQWNISQKKDSTTSAIGQWWSWKSSW